MSKWKANKLTDEGDVVKELPDPELEREMLELQERIEELQAEVETKNNKIVSTIKALQEQSRLAVVFKADVGEKATEIALLKEEVGRAKMETLIAVREKKDSEKRYEDIANQREAIVALREECKKIIEKAAEEGKAQEKLDSLEQKARAGDYSKDFVRTLQRLLRD